MWLESQEGIDLLIDQHLTNCLATLDQLPSNKDCQATKNGCWTSVVFGRFIVYFVEFLAQNCFLYDRNMNT